MKKKIVLSLTATWLTEDEEMQRHILPNEYAQWLKQFPLTDEIPDK